MSNRAVAVRCLVCGLEVVGVREANGLVRASDRSRPAPNAPVVPGYCITHAEGPKRKRIDWSNVVVDEGDEAP